MPKYVIFKDDGTIKAAGVGSFPPPAATVLELPLTATAMASMMLVDRPTAPAMVVDGSSYTLPDCVDGTTVRVADQSGGEWLLDQTIVGATVDVVFSLTDPGTYSIEVEFPLPYMPRVTEVVIP